MSILDLPTNKLELIKRLNDILRNSSDEDVKAISGALDFYAVKPIANEAKTTVDEVKHVEHAKTDKCCAFCDGDERLDPDYDDYEQIQKAAQDEEDDEDVHIDYAKDEKTFQKQQVEASLVYQSIKAQNSSKDQAATNDVEPQITIKSEIKQEFEIRTCYYCGIMAKMPDDVCPECRWSLLSDGSPEGDLTQAQYGQYIGTYTVQTPVITSRIDPYASIASQSMFPELHKLPSATQPLDPYHRLQPAQQVQFVTATYAVYQTQHKPGFWDAVTGQYNAQEGKYYQGMRHVRVG